MEVLQRHDCTSHKKAGCKPELHHTKQLPYPWHCCSSREPQRIVHCCLPGTRRRSEPHTSCSYPLKKRGTNQTRYLQNLSEEAAWKSLWHLPNYKSKKLKHNKWILGNRSCLLLCSPNSLFFSRRKNIKENLYDAEGILSCILVSNWGKCRKYLKKS